MKSEENIQIGYFDKTIPEIKFIKSISESEYIEFVSHKNVVLTFLSHRDLFQIFFQNYKALDNYLGEYSEKEATKAVMHFDNNSENRSDFSLNINRHLLNILSSARTFIDHTDRDIKNRYGDNSNELHNYRNLLASQFDNNFAYRFFYKLRNYAQHKGLPLDRVLIDMVQEKNGDISCEIKLEFETSELLANFSDWGKVKLDLQKMPEKFDLRPLIVSYAKTMVFIAQSIEGINLNQQKSSANYLKDRLFPFRENGREICIFKNIKTNDEKLNFEYLSFPFRTIDEILTAQ